MYPSNKPVERGAVIRVKGKSPMTSPGVRTEIRIGPLYFFDQPARQSKGTRSSILHLYAAHGAPPLEGTMQRNQEEGDKEGKSNELNKEDPSGETCGDDKPDISSAVGAARNIQDHNPMDSYRRAAPQLLNELALLLSQHKRPEKRCIPHGIENILNYSWHDLTAGAVISKSPKPADKQRRSKGSLQSSQTPHHQVSASAKQETGERNACVVGKTVCSGRKSPLRSNPRVKKCKQNSKRAHNSTTASFSIASSSCKASGWTFQTKQPSCDEPQRISLCQWVVERLQAVRSPGKLQTIKQDLNTPLILRHYGDTKTKLKERSRKIQTATLVNGMPQIPEVKQQSPGLQKLHYRINDGSSFIFYPSGIVAVCQSHSGLPCGGFYTNVFSDSECAVILATITAFGHGAVTHPLSSVITAVWDQDGGFMYDHDGNITKEWSWQTNRTPRDQIVIQLSDRISVRLLSGMSAMLTFRYDNESVQLPLSSLSNINQSKEMPCLQTEGKFTSDAAQDLLVARKKKCPSGAPESTRSLMPTPVSVCSQEVLQMVQEVKEPEELPAQWRRGGHAGRELKRLQQRVRSILEDWLDYYRVAIGIKCPDMERMPDAPPRTRLRREPQSAALPSLNPPERADAKQVQPEEGRDEFRQLHKNLSATAERPPDSSVKLPRTPTKKAKESHAIVIGPLQIHGNIQLESVILPKSPESQACIATPSPAVVPLTPFMVCPALLRAALLGEGQQWRRRCCCSTTLMPTVTDLEYDAFVMGQPPHSQQMLVVCVSLPRRPISTHTMQSQDALDELYKRRNKHRTMPCTQCQMDSFRLVRYEMTTGNPGCGSENTLLLQRHNAAPGMVLMYIRGKLLFVGYTLSCSARELQKQISRTRADYRLGLSLPSHYKFSKTMNTTGATDVYDSSTLTGGDDLISSASEEKKTKTSHTSEASLQQKRDFCIKPKTPPTSLHVPVMIH